MKCKICFHESNFIFAATILKKYNIKYYFCDNCGFLQTEEPYWLDEAYSEPISISDTGYLQRNLYLSQKMTILLSIFFNKEASFLDYGGGYGVFVRLMRDIGFDFYWYDKYATNIFARGFEYKDDMEIEAITSFETFEHFVNPLDEIKSMIRISKNIIFTTELLPYPIPKPQEWWYYGLNHGQHISFYSKRTLQYIAKKFNLNYYGMGSLHLLTNKNIPKVMFSILKLDKFGFHKLLQIGLKSKTLDDNTKLVGGDSERNIY
ncbi:MAG: class I SAM-dependent methyltransferase [Elusimicrobiota bacterium]|nr:class I SAM-dependent methyltransferase [Endomicrobiia bacterium]MDW8166532.1 class I SAM-dependent methyltransferase [Elusimicrobiota bacterium]